MFMKENNEKLINGMKTLSKKHINEISRRSFEYNILCIMRSVQICAFALQGFLLHT